MKGGLLPPTSSNTYIYPFTQLSHMKDESFNPKISFRPLNVVLFLLQIFRRTLIQERSRPLFPRALKNVTCKLSNNRCFCIEFNMGLLLSPRILLFRQLDWSLSLEFVHLLKHSVKIQPSIVIVPLSYHES